MSVDELTEYKLERKAKTNALRDEMDEAEGVLAGKLRMQAAQDALERVGITGLTLSPAAATIGVEPGQVGED